MAPRATIHLYDLDDYTLKLITNTITELDIGSTVDRRLLVTDGEVDWATDLTLRVSERVECEDVFKLLAEVMPVADPEWFEHEGDAELSGLATEARDRKAEAERLEYVEARRPLNQLRAFAERNYVLVWLLAGLVALTYWALAIYGGVK